MPRHNLMLPLIKEHNGAVLQSSCQSGFTLIEVMVALLVVAVSLGALSYGLGHAVSQEQKLNQRVVGSWVAQNRLARLYLNKAVSSQVQSQSMLGQRWQTEIVQIGTPLPGVTQIEVRAKQIASDEPSKQPTPQRSINIRTIVSSSLVGGS
ncbi:type II secretion system protein GspI [Thiomicrospira sp. WB1]|uniref:type II secretion system protein GspI n=1 Tax=Thiomicrospira sp. WB1 TaxID=1685380 RepID=UPI0007480350|nr:type II secretion system protein GspI [Thiomicrospira sp. WB1]KUJ72431.1 hypothetical protein AVO41_01040 [Thiomicrospira sp. WB1]